MRDIQTETSHITGHLDWDFTHFHLYKTAFGLVRSSIWLHALKRLERHSEQNTNGHTQNPIVCNDTIVEKIAN